MKPSALSMALLQLPVRAVTTVSASEAQPVSKSIYKAHLIHRQAKITQE